MRKISSDIKTPFSRDSAKKTGKRTKKKKNGKVLSNIFQKLAIFFTEEKCAALVISVLLLNFVLVKSYRVLLIFFTSRGNLFEKVLHTVRFGLFRFKFNVRNVVIISPLTWRTIYLGLNGSSRRSWFFLISSSILEFGLSTHTNRLYHVWTWSYYKSHHFVPTISSSSLNLL